MGCGNSTAELTQDIDELLEQIIGSFDHKKKTNLVEKLHQHVIEARTNTLFQGFSGKIIFRHDHEYNQARRQYATSSYPKDEMSPFAILYPQNDGDVKIALNGAFKGNYKVVIRSGGHQYCGLSSGNIDYIQLDMEAFTEATYKKETNLLTIGVGNNLRRVTNFLDENRISLPSGQCFKVGIGGHVQTGGWGNILRSFGLTVDYVVGFDIILASGELKTIYKDNKLSQELIKRSKLKWLKDDDNKDENEQNDADLFWAVLGGNPGSFGVITRWRFNPIIDDQHPKSYGGNLYWWWNKNTYKKIMKVMKKYAEDPEFPPDYDFMVTCGCKDLHFGSVSVIWLNLLYGDKKGNEEPDKKWFKEFHEINKIQQIPPELTEMPLEGYHRVSYMMRKMFRVNQAREYPYPYIKSLYGSFDVYTDDFIDLHADRVDKLLSKNADETGLWYIGQFQIGGGATESNDPNSINTSISRRKCKFGMTNDVFYEKHRKKFREEAEKWHNNLYEKVIKLKDFWSKNGEDVRFTWGTFGNTNINDVWQYYYDNEQKYVRLNKIKTNFDPKNIFHNSFTLPGYYKN